VKTSYSTVRENAGSNDTVPVSLGMAELCTLLSAVLANKADFSSIH